LFSLNGTGLFALTANKVWFEFHPGFYRVYAEYTIPELRQLRTAVGEFRSKKQAEKFYFSLIKGGEFKINSHGEIVFPKEPTEPQPW
jgi:hypothetical protein